MAWTTPKTWTSEVLTSDDMNTYLSDNTQYLYDELNVTLPTDIFTRTDTTDYSTTSTTFVDIDDPNMVSTITTTGGDVLVTFTAEGQAAATAEAHFALVVDGVEEEVLQTTVRGSTTTNCSFTYTFTGLGAGSHTFRIRYKTSATDTLVIQGENAQWTVRELA